MTAPTKRPPADRGQGRKSLSTGTISHIPSNNARLKRKNEMTTVLYSAIRPAINQTVADVIKKAQKMGYTMTIFSGFDDEDLGMYCGERKGPRRDDANANLKILMEIQDACEVSSDFPHIIQTRTIPDGYVVA